MAERSMRLKIVTPQQVFYDSEVEMVMVTKPSGKEGFMAGHTPAFMLLTEDEVKITEKGGVEKKAFVKGGHVHVREDMEIFTSNAVWKKSE